MSELPKNVSAFVDRHGKTRYRYRKVGKPIGYFVSPPGSAGFAAELAEFEAATLPRPRRRIGPLPKGERVYFIGGISGPLKIGVTTDLRSRLKTLQIASSQPLYVLTSVPGGRETESYFHRKFEGHRLEGEWFKRHPELMAEIGRLKSADG